MVLEAVRLGRRMRLLVVALEVRRKEMEKERAELVMARRVEKEKAIKKEEGVMREKVEQEVAARVEAAVAEKKAEWEAAAAARVEAAAEEAFRAAWYRALAAARDW